MRKRQIVTATGEILPHPTDVYVGERMRLRRMILKMTQLQLAQKIGLTFQQIQKYEKGTNQISVGRLWDISQALSVNINFFFRDMKKQKTDDPMQRREAMELVNAYYKINNRDLAASLLTAIKEAARSSWHRQN